MLLKLNNRYSAEQIQFLQICSLLKLRYKSQHQHLHAAVTKFKDDVRVVCEKVLVTQETQNEIPPTQGQDMRSLSRRRKTIQEKSAFDFEDDDENLVVMGKTEMNL